MHKICLLSLVISSSLYPMLGSALRLTMRSPISAGRAAAVMPMHRSFADKASEEFPSIREFVQLLDAQEAKVDPALLARLRYREISDDELDSQIKNVGNLYSWDRYLEQEKVRWHSYEKFREVAAAEIFGKDYVNVCKAVRMQDHEVLAHLLVCGADPNANAEPHAEYSENAVNIAMENDDLLSLSLLKEAGASVYEIRNISGMSVAMFKYLLEQGVRERDPWHHQSYVRNLVHTIDTEISDKRSFILKAMLAVNSGATANPYMGREGRLLESHRARDLEKAFPNFIDYLRAAHTLQSEENSTKKKAAEAKIRRIMKEYGIKKEHVLVLPVTENESPRVQEAE